MAEQPDTDEILEAVIWWHEKTGSISPSEAAAIRWGYAIARDGMDQCALAWLKAYREWKEKQG